MQLHLIMPFILIPLAVNFKIGIAWLVTVSIVSVIIPTAISVANDYPPFPVVVTTIESHYDYMTGLYLTPWCRAGSMIVGLWTGMLLALNYSLANFNKLLMYCVTIVFGCIMGVIIFTPYKYNHIGTFDPYGNAESAFYNGFARPAWAIAISFIVMACHTGGIKSVNNFLSWTGWRPISRLTFAIYLVHPVVQVWWLSTQFVPLYFTYLSKIMESAGIFFISFVVSVVLSAFIERPVVNIYRKILMPKPDGSLEDDKTNGVLNMANIQIPRVHLKPEQPSDTASIL